MSFDPPFYRFTVRMPPSRYAELRQRAKDARVEPGALIQSLFDSLDLTGAGAAVPGALADLDRRAMPAEQKKIADSVGLTLRELLMFRALARLAGQTRITRAPDGDIATASGVPERYLDAALASLEVKGFIARREGRGRRTWKICRFADL